MASEALSGAVRPNDTAVQEIDDLLEQVARLSHGDLPPLEFHREVLGRAVRALAAMAGAVCVGVESGVVRFDAQVDLSSGGILQKLAGEAAHTDLVERVIAAGEPRIVLPHAALGAGPTPNPTEYLLLICPMTIGAEGAASGALEIVQRPGGSPASHQGHLRLMEALCELTADFHQQRRMRSLKHVAERGRLVDQFTLDVHASLNPEATAFTIANEGRRVIECDRFSVAIRQGRTLRLVAVSGLASFERRSNIVLRLEELANAVVAAGEEFWFPADAEHVAPQIAGPLHAWQDESHARSVAIIPLYDSARADEKRTGPRAFAALIAERFAEDLPEEDYRGRLYSVCRHAERALQNSADYAGFPFFRLLSAVRSARWFVAARQLPKTVSLGVAALAAAAALVFIPADFEVEGRGLLQPARRRNVFARSDGIVSEVRTDHGRECHEGDVLVVMTKSQLEFETSRVLGETQTARKRLAGVQASRLDLAPQTAADREKYNQLTADEEEVQELLRSLEQQHQMLNIQRDELVVRSPLDGQVVTWNVRQSLEARPVERGQILMQIADLSGPWVLEVEVADDRMGHVLAAREKFGPNLAVSFMLATEPGIVYQGAIEEVALATDVRPPEKAHVLITVGLDRAQISQKRPSATAVSRIHCGRRSVGFVWFHNLWEILQKKVLF